MVKKYIFAVLLLGSWLVNAAINNASSASRLALGTIQFPAVVTKIPSVCIYYGGHKLKTTTQESNNQILFSIPKSSSQKKFYLLVTQSIDIGALKGKHDLPEIINPVGYLRVHKGKPYRLFELSLTESVTDKESLPGLPQHPTDGSQRLTDSTQMEGGTMRWHISECALTTAEMRIPDPTIVFLYDPCLIDSLITPEDSFALPTIKLKPNILELVGSEQKLHEFSNALLLSALDIDTIHGQLTESVKLDDRRALIAAPTV